MKGRKKTDKPAESVGPKEDAVRTYITSDGVKFEVEYDTLKKQSQLIRNLEPEAATFTEVDSQTFRHILRFAEIHKDLPDPKPLPMPLPVTSLSLIVDKADIELLEEIKSSGESHFEKVLNAASYFQIEYLKELLCASIAENIISKDKETLMKEYGVQSNIEQQGFKEEMRGILRAMRM